MLRAPGRASRVPRSRQATRVRDRYRDPILYRAAPMQSDRPPSWSARHAVRNPRRANYREPGHRSYPRTCDLRPGRPLRFCPPQPVRPEDARSDTRRRRVSVGSPCGPPARDVVRAPGRANRRKPGHRSPPRRCNARPGPAFRSCPPEPVRPEDAPVGTRRYHVSAGPPCGQPAPAAVRDPGRAHRRKPDHRPSPRTGNRRPVWPLQYRPPQPVRPEDSPADTRRCHASTPAGRSSPRALRDSARTRHRKPSHRPSPRTCRPRPKRPPRTSRTQGRAM